MSEELMPFDLPKTSSSIIKVLGVGGGGSNAVNHMFKQGIKDVDFIVSNTDSQALVNSPVPIKVQLGSSLTGGRGAGNKPGRGREAAIENLDDVLKALGSNTKMVFVTAGMGGGTGTGAAPVIAKATKELEILTVGIVTIPFKFEGQRRISQAIEGIQEFSQYVDSLLVINNEKLREIYGDSKLSDAFAQADNVLTVAAKGIAEIITVHGHMNVDFADVQTVMTDSGVALMGQGAASGDGRAIKAIQEALSSPLLNNNDIHGAKNILLNITSGTDEATMDEIGAINDYVQESAGFYADLIWGNTQDPSLGDKISVTVIATGFKTDIIPEVFSGQKSTPEKVIMEDSTPETDEDNKSVVFDLDNNTSSGNIFDDFFGGQTDDNDNTYDPILESEEGKSGMLSEDFMEQEPLDTFSKESDKIEIFPSIEKNKERHKTLEKSTGNKRKYNYIDNLDELENEPAFKRRNIDIGMEKPSIENSKISKYTLSEDEENNPKLRPGNSYLHNRVD